MKAGTSAMPHFNTSMSTNTFNWQSETHINRLPQSICQQKKCEMLSINFLATWKLIRGLWLLNCKRNILSKDTRLPAEHFASTLLVIINLHSEKYWCNKFTNLKKWETLN